MVVFQPEYFKIIWKNNEEEKDKKEIDKKKKLGREELFLDLQLIQRYTQTLLKWGEHVMV